MFRNNDVILLLCGLNGGIYLSIQKRSYVEKKDKNKIKKKDNDFLDPPHYI